MIFSNKTTRHFIATAVPADRDVDGVVEMLLDTIQRYAEPQDEGAFIWMACSSNR
jgi:hypothetical protein